MVCISADDVNDEYYIIASLSFLSAIGGLFVIIPYCVMVTARSYSFKIVFYISCSDFLRSILFMIPSHKIANLNICIALSYLFQITIFNSII